MAGRWFRPTPDGMGLHPDGAASPPPPHPMPRPTGPLWRQPAFRSLSLSFALGLTAQMGLLTVLFSIMAPSLGEAGAGLAMSAATACAVVGRTAVGALLPGGADRRVAGTLNFLVQAAGSAALAFSGGGPALLVLGAVLFGLGIGNLLSLPPLIAQRDWPPAEVARVVAMVTAVNQAFYAFGPGLFGAAMESFGAWAPPAAAGVLQLVAAAVLVVRRR
jgi:predicted MFS family arabinose efflux permease